MSIYRSKKTILPGTSYIEVKTFARKEHKRISALTKRQPYVRSAYFNKDKVFISVFWTHIMQKNSKVRACRLKLYSAAIDLIQNTQHMPETIYEKNNKSVMLYRFYGVTRDGVHFCVQVKQDVKTDRLDFMSVFDKKSA